MSAAIFESWGRFCDKTPTIDTVLYHANCYDGFCAAWLLHGHFPNANYIPVQFGQDLPDDTYFLNMHILIVDFSYPREILESIRNKAKSLWLLDHHKTAKDKLELHTLPYCTIDLTKSGARLTWEYLRTLGYQPPTGSGRAHWLIDYTEDRDLWKHTLPHTKEINTALHSYPFDFDTWNTLAARTPESLIPEGTAIQRYKNNIIQHHAHHARLTTIDGHQAIIAQCTLSTIGSDIANHLLTENPHIPIAIITIDTPDGTIYRLRSQTIDVSKIAENYGGGGHKAAAAFKLPDFNKTSQPIPKDEPCQQEPNAKTANT